MSLSNDLKAVQLWPIKAKGAVQRRNPLGDPQIENLYHKALEQGRMRENSIADANHFLLHKKEEFTHRIRNYLDINQVVVHGQTISDHGRAALFVIDSIKFLQTVNEFQQNVVALVQALTTNIGILTSIERNVLAMVQANLNAIALLLNNICNWGLPKLPSIPNLTPDTTWNFNGFNFSPLAALAALKPNLKFDTNFAFNQCQLHPPNTNIFQNVPSSVQTYSGLSYGTPLFIPPLDGTVPPVDQNLSSSAFVSQMQATTTTPVYGPSGSSLPDTSIFNPNSSMLGSVPDPSTIISNYQMPAQTYHDNIVSIVPTIRDNNVVLPSDIDYASPNLIVRRPNLRRDLVHFINLETVVATNYDPSITAAWLFYLDLTRIGRGGNWLAHFQAVYDSFIKPSLHSLATNNVPWNNVLGGIGVSDTPNDIPFVDVLKAMAPTQLGTTLWKLSFVEASLLGYTRTKLWDTWQDANYLSGATGSDLDYMPTVIDSVQTSTIVLGQDTAEFPVPCTFPTAIAGVLNQVIAQATIDIQNDVSYQSPRLGNRFIYDQFAQARLVDRFTQFWRDFNTNMKALLAQDSYLLKFTVTYFATLNGATNPLGDPADYNALKADAASRSRSWTPGTPLLPIPKAPIVTYQNNGNPTSGQSGWQGINFNPVTFLLRPDVQGQPIPVQIAMLRTNLSYAGVLQFRDRVQAEFQTQIQTAQNLLTSVQQFGFKVEAVIDVTIVPPAGIALPFDQVDFDFTGNVTTPDKFTIQSTGEYAVFGSVNWDTGPAGSVRTLTVFKNGVPILIQSTDPSLAGPVTLLMSGLADFRTGDVVQIVATHGFTDPQTVLPGSFFSMVQSGPIPVPASLPPESTDSARTFVAGSDFPALTVLAVQSNGTVVPIDPTTIQPLDGTALAPNPDGVALVNGIAGSPVQVGTTYGGVFQVGGAGFTAGGLLYAGPGGIITQDYATLITEVRWIVCVGRALDAETFIYEPHVPTRILWSA